MPRRPVYKNPQTPSHIRAVLHALDYNAGLAETDVAVIDGVIYRTGTASGAIAAAGRALYAPSAGNIALAQADTLAKSHVVGFSTAAISNGATGQFQAVGIMTVSGIAAGTAYFLSAVTAGTMVSSPDAGSGQYIKFLGVGVDTDRFLFCPAPAIKLR